MIFDEPGEHEIEETDPEEQLDFDVLDSEHDLAPDPPEAPTPSISESEAPDDLVKAFWSIVLVVNVALFSLSLGLMFVGFRGRWRFGGALVALGVLSFAHAYYIYTTSEYLSGDEETAE